MIILPAHKPLFVQCFDYGGDFLFVKSKESLDLIRPHCSADVNHSEHKLCDDREALFSAYRASNPEALCWERKLHFRER
jgi:hypothetical protein